MGGWVDAELMKYTQNSPVYIGLNFLWAYVYDMLGIFLFSFSSDQILDTVIYT